MKISMGFAMIWSKSQNQFFLLFWDFVCYTFETIFGFVFVLVLHNFMSFFSIDDVMVSTSLRSNLHLFCLQKQTNKTFRASMQDKKDNFLFRINFLVLQIMNTACLLIIAAINPSSFFHKSFN